MCNIHIYIYIHARVEKYTHVCTYVPALEGKHSGQPQGTFRGPQLAPGLYPDPWLDPKRVTIGVLESRPVSKVDPP